MWFGVCRSGFIPFSQRAGIVVFFAEDRKLFVGGVLAWYKRRYARILIPYLLISCFANVLAVASGGKSITVAVLDITTINYWLCHRGAWFIAMLVPLYSEFFTFLY